MKMFEKETRCFDFLMFEGEVIISLDVSVRGHIHVLSNLGRHWVSTFTPVEYLDFVEVTQWSI